MHPSAAQRYLDLINGDIFLREFAFSRNGFTPRPGEEVEFCDSAIWLGDVLIVIQLKERDRSANAEPNVIARWFDRKVHRDATRQIRETLRYLDEHPDITLTNGRAQAFNVNTGDFRTIHKIVLYELAGEIPATVDNAKFYISESTGVRLFIHVICLADWELLCGTLRTPGEMLDYLEFRESYLQGILDAYRQSEKSLLGRFVMGDDVASLRLDARRDDFSSAVDNLEEARRDWDIRWVFANMPEKHYPTTTPWDVGKATRYFPVLLPFALMRRSELGAFKDRLKIALDSVRVGAPANPIRFHLPSRGCAYVVVPIPSEDFEQRFDIMRVMAEVTKYECAVTKCAVVGVSLAGSQVYFDWLYAEGPWNTEEAFLAKLQELGSPFGPMRATRLTAYTTHLD